ncbi:HAMP domain-containing histidine kinase [Marinobacter sediminum]|uniref:sensor histidine kinase n=1 Tax=Marinobacter sediminum TaxID=256323 RepID=UPI00202EDD9F|nr:HAMP domain-containing sensor histidine kinase [Marinobacter sediminum]MCM0611138.1 HAMP domain-containing histidine kinase [Marinobacter sediminum]
MRLLPRRAASQLVLLVIVVMLAAQGVTFWMMVGERQGALQTAGLNTLLTRVSNAYSLVNIMPPAERDRALLALADPLLTLSSGPAPALPADASAPFSEWLLTEGPLAGLVPEGESIRTRILVDDDRCERDDDREHEHEEHHHRDEDLIDEYHEDWRKRMQKMDCPPVLDLSLRLTDGNWLNAVASPPQPSWLWLKAALMGAGITAVLLILAVLFAVRYILAPVRRLREAAQSFSRGNPRQLPEQGPEDIRDVIRAFNHMQVQVGRSQDEKARLLAALAHDLRTPVTAMRLRVEMLPEGEDRSRLLENLAEMQSLAEDTLEFIRGSASESGRRYDLSALLESLCDDLSEIGMPVKCGELPRCVLSGRPEAVRRAVRNLIENAVKYGEQAEVFLKNEPGGVSITIADRGPGIPGELREKVFEPFFRVETSRSRESGGAGLGLAIARTLILGMGGSITIGDREDQQGAVVTVRLPSRQ